jgi:hypothetical protein
VAMPEAYQSLRPLPLDWRRTMSVQRPSQAVLQKRYSLAYMLAGTLQDEGFSQPLKAADRLLFARWRYRTGHLSDDTLPRWASDIVDRAFEAAKRLESTP